MSVLSFAFVWSSRLCSFSLEYHADLLLLTHLAGFTGPSKKLSTISDLAKEPSSKCARGQSFCRSTRPDFSYLLRPFRSLDRHDSPNSSLSTSMFSSVTASTLSLEFGAQDPASHQDERARDELSQLRLRVTGLERDNSSLEMRLSILEQIFESDVRSSPFSSFRQDPRLPRRRRLFLPFFKIFHPPLLSFFSLPLPRNSQLPSSLTTTSSHPPNPRR